MKESPAPPCPGPVASRRRKLVFACVAVVASLGLIEGAARIVEVFRPVRPVDVGAGFTADSRVFVASGADPGVFVTDPAKRVYFQPQQFRVKKPPGTLRIFVIGGSSVNRLESEFRVLESGLAQSGLFQRLSGRYSRAEVVNVGGLSYGSGRLVGVASEVLGYEPDLVVLYEANNEFEELQQFHLASLSTLTVQRTLSHSAAVRLLRDAATDWKLAKIRREVDEEYRRCGATAVQREGVMQWQYEFTREDIERRMDAFRQNYELIESLCRARGVPLVIGTVPSNLVQPQMTPRQLMNYQRVNELLDSGRHAEAHALGRRLLVESLVRHQASDVENGIIRELARSRQLPLADVETAIVDAEPHHVPGETLFTDHCHLNAEGNRIWRETVQRTIVEAMSPR